MKVYTEENDRQKEHILINETVCSTAFSFETVWLVNFYKQNKWVSSTSKLQL